MVGPITFVIAVGVVVALALMTARARAPHPKAGDGGPILGGPHDHHHHHADPGGWDGDSGGD